jgi:hypothetical protein
MAGPQATSQTKSKFGDRYPVPDHNRPVSTVYFNEVKIYMQEKYLTQLTKWVAFFKSEDIFYTTLRNEMDKYTFNFPDNQCRWFFAMLEEKHYDKQKEEESSAKVRIAISESQEDSQ